MTTRFDDRLERWLRESAVHKRETANLANLSVSGNTTTSVSASRSADFYVTIEVGGAWSGFGTVTVNGLDSNSDAAAAGLTFTGNHRKTATGQAFRSISSVVTTGFTGSGTIKVWATDITGQFKEELTVVNSSLRCAVTRERHGQLVEGAGGAPLDAAKIFLFPNSGVKRNDRIILFNETWEVKAIQPRRNFRRERAFDVAIVYAEDQS